MVDLKADHLSALAAECNVSSLIPPCRSGNGPRNKLILYIYGSTCTCMHGVPITGPKLNFPTCPVYQNMTFPHISNTYLAEDRAILLCKQMKCVENVALSYRFPTCTKSKFSSCGLSVGFQ